MAPMSLRKIDHVSKQITYNVYSYYKKRKLDPKTYEHQVDVNLINLVSQVTGLSKSTVTRVIQNGNAMKIEEGEAVFKPEEKKKHVRRKRIKIDEFTESIIRRRVIQFYKTKKEVPSVRKLNALLKSEKILNCSNEYLRQLLHKLGFTNSEKDATGILRERTDIAKDRLQYLKALKEFRENGKSIFYLNKTGRRTHDDGFNIVNGTMPSVIAVHADGRTGFPHREIVMMIKPRHNEETESDIFEWLNDPFLISVPHNSVVVLNMPYCETFEAKQHDEKPTFAATRGDLQDWLKRHNVPFKDTDQKTHLFELIKAQDIKPEFNISATIKKYGHEVLYLPQCHPDLNPAVVAWEALKEKSDTTSPYDIFADITNTLWQKYFDQVKANENEYYENDIKMDNAIDLMSKVKDEEEEDSDEDSDMDD